MHIEKLYFTLPEVIERWRISETDLVYLAENDKLRLSVRVFGEPVEFGDYEEGQDGERFRVPWEQKPFSGLLDLHACDVFQLFRCGELHVSEFRTPRADYASLYGDAKPVFVMIPAGVIHGDLGSETRRRILAAYAAGEIQVIVNVAVLTEGWDHPPTSCVVLLRPSSCKSTMIQMVGRGLRTIDPAEHPGIVKTDCIVLDFGISSLTHGTLEQDVDLDGRDPTPCDAPTKTCPECEATVPLAARQCPICGHEFLSNGHQPLDTVVLTEIDLLKRSSFAWEDLFDDESALMASGFNAWGGVFFLEGRWHAVGGAKTERTRLLGVGERTVCLAQADDWLNTHETDESAFKSRRWLSQTPTEKQLQYLSPQQRQDYGLTRYRASALITFLFNRRDIRRLVMTAAPERRAA